MTDTTIAVALVAQRLEQLQERIHRAATSVGRDPSDILVVAITKTHGPPLVEAAYEQGLRHFGENRVEEAEGKLPDLSSRHPEMIWHMVGHIQSRKAGRVPSLFSYVHSVDRLKIAQRLSQAAVEENKSLDVFLEVNLTGEETKYGFDLSRWPDDDAQFETCSQAVEAMSTLPNLRVDGLMTMPPYTHDPETARPVFARLVRLRDALAKRFPQSAWTHLSMGMTSDFEVAIQEGATMVRIGTAIFGPRKV